MEPPLPRRRRRCVLNSLGAHVGVELERLELFSELGRALTSTVDPDVLLERVTRLVVPRLAEWAALYLWEDGRLRLGCVVHRDPEKEHELFQLLPELDALHDELLARVVHGEAPVLCIETTLDAPDPGSASLGVPLLGARGLVGVLSFHSAPGGRHYDAKDLALAQELAHRATLAWEHARHFQEAQAAIRWRDEVVAIVTHDLRNPLNAIALELNQLRRPWGDGEHEDRREGRGQLDAIKRSLERVGRMVDDLLVASTMKAGRLRVHPRPERVDRLLLDLSQMLGPLARQRGVTFDVVAASELPDVSCDHDRALQVLGNLVSNALTVSRRGAVVKVAVHAGETFVTFSVTDEGPGLPGAQLERVFERAWRGTSGDRAGFGLGLFIVKGLVEAHGGRVWAEPHAGVGLTFCFTLPRAPPGSAAPA